MVRGPQLASRFCRRCKAGIWDALFAVIVREADIGGRSDRDIRYADSAVVRAHQHAAGAADSSPENEAPGRSRGGFGTEVHIRSEGNGLPPVVLPTPGRQHDSTVFEKVMESNPVKRKGRGRPEIRPRRVVADKAYSGRGKRRYLRRRGVRYTVPHKRNETRRGPFDKEIYKKRNLIGRLINRMKQFRRAAARYEKQSKYHRIILVIVSIVLWLKE